MTRTEHLLWIIAEECAEVAQRASKAARFGLEEVQPEYVRGLKVAARLAKDEFDRSPYAATQGQHDSVWMGGYESACDHLSAAILELIPVPPERKEQQ